MPQKKLQPGKGRKGNDMMKQMGLLGGMDEGESDEDIDLEAELLRLEGNSVSSAKKPKSKKKADIASLENLAENIDTEIGSDEELSGDEDELIKELEGLSSEDDEETEESPSHPAQNDIPGLLGSRLDTYYAALNVCTDGTKRRRYDRAIKTLQSQMKDVRAGRPIDESLIPPEVKIEKPKEPPAPQTANLISLDSAPPPAKSPTPAHSAPVAAQPQHTPMEVSSSAKLSPISNITPSQAVSAVPAVTSQVAPNALGDDRIPMLSQRRDQYQHAAAVAKQSGNNPLALKYLRIRKDFDKVLSAIADGHDVDLSKIPPPPPELQSHIGKSSPASEPPSVQNEQVPVKETASEGFLTDVAAPTSEEAKSLFNAPESATDTMGALQQRLKKYQDSEKEATEQGNSSKARRMGRIVKQYLDAIKACKAGKPFDYSELPTPPGFGEIPLPNAGPPKKTAPPRLTEAPQRETLPTVQSQSPAGPSLAGHSLAGPSSAAPSAAMAAASGAQGSQQQQVKPKVVSPPKRQASLSIQEKQLDTLKKRQLEYKKAALEAKTHDDKELALKYMRIIKGMNPMIQAATNGLPVDMNQMPPPPASTHETGYVIVNASDVADISPEGREEEYKKLINDLNELIKRSSNNAIHYKAMGDVKNAFVFENLEQNCRKDLDAVQNAFRHNDPVPKYHYETRQYSTIKMNTDLGDADLEIKIIRGIQYPLPPEIKAAKDFDTQVHYELPWPQEEVQKGHSDWCKHSDNPTYEHTDRLRIDRRSKSMLRAFKGRKLKLELYYRRGFLKADKHFATVSIKLDQLEKLVTVHDSFDLLDVNGRKEIGGKLEVILRMREPLSQKQVEVMNEKWLVIDQFVRLDKPVHKDQKQPVNKSIASVVQPQVSNVRLQSLEVLKYEKKELDTKIRQYSTSGQLSPADLAKLTRKSTEMAHQIDSISTMMRRNQLSPHEYVQVLSQLNQSYQSSMKTAAETGDRKRLQLLNLKKDIIAKEIRAWQARMNTGK